MIKPKEHEYDSLKQLWKRSCAYRVLLKTRGDVAYTLLQWSLGMAFKLQRYMPKTEYKHVSDGDIVDINWRVREALSLSCCDCGLVHYVRFFAAGGKVRMKLWRDDEATEHHRTQRGITIDHE